MDAPTTTKTRAKTRARRKATPRTPDRSALLLMLSYVEAECRRLGADAAARHAAMAAALVPDHVAQGTSAMH